LVARFLSTLVLVDLVAAFMCILGRRVSNVLRFAGLLVRPRQK